MRVLLLLLLLGIDVTLMMPLILGSVILMRKSSWERRMGVTLVSDSVCDLGNFHLTLVSWDVK